MGEGGFSMIQKDLIFQLEEKLLQSRRDILRVVDGFETGWKDLQGPETEFEESAQKEDISQILDQLEGRERRELLDIDAALQKIALGNYGYCELCGRSIPLKRLDAIPSTRLCTPCARAEEDPRSVMAAATAAATESTLPEAFEGMSDDSVAEAIHDYLVEDGRVELDHLTITCRYGVIVLEGTLETGFSHQLLLEILEDDLGFSRIDDLTGIAESLVIREEETPDEKDEREEEELLQGEEVDDDIFESRESGTSVMPPEQIRLP